MSCGVKGVLALFAVQPLADEPYDAPPKRGTGADSLSRVLERSKHAGALMQVCAEQLSSVNDAIEQALASRDALPGIQDALGRNVALAGRAQAASAELSSVNRALQAAIRDRDLVDHQFAASEEQERASRRAAFHDGLTGLPNRALFNDRLEHGFEQAQRHGWSLAVMFVDLDDFKIINDTHGHAAGDSVLQAIAHRLTDNARGEDTVSRLGGDEFLYLLTGVRDESNIGMIADKIIRAIQVPYKFTLRDAEIHASVGASIGISIFPKNGTSVETLIKSADAAMYRAKQAGSGYAFAH
jgi:diguanylate cyclase